MAPIARIPWDLVKIDRSFVTGLGEDPSATAVVRAVVAMADALGIRTAAEGVTRMAQLEALIELGCDVAQGPLFCRAETADAVRDMLVEDRRWATGQPAATA
jgi:EAL domain-containing protein (putative c-di-GMP-specific phosphodiesterase class I)